MQNCVNVSAGFVSYIGFIGFIELISGLEKVKVRHLRLTSCLPIRAPIFLETKVLIGISAFTCCLLSTVCAGDLSPANPGEGDEVKLSTRFFHKLSDVSVFLSPTMMTENRARVIATFSRFGSLRNPTVCEALLLIRSIKLSVWNSYPNYLTVEMMMISNSWPWKLSTVDTFTLKNAR